MVKTFGQGAGAPGDRASAPRTIAPGAVDGPAAIRARVANLVYFGTDTHCHMNLCVGTEVVARLQSPADGETGLVQGQEVGICLALGAAQRVED